MNSPGAADAQGDGPPQVRLFRLPLSPRPLVAVWDEPRQLWCAAGMWLRTEELGDAEPMVPASALAALLADLGDLARVAPSDEAAVWVRSCADRLAAVLAGLGVSSAGEAA